MLKGNGMTSPTEKNVSAANSLSPAEAAVLEQMHQHTVANDVEAMRGDEYFYWFWEMGIYEPADYAGFVQAWARTESAQFQEAKIGTRYVIGQDIPNNYPMGYPDGTHVVVLAGSIVEVVETTNRFYRLFRLIQPGSIPTSQPATRAEELAGTTDQRPLARTREPAQIGYEFYLCEVGMQNFRLLPVAVR
jgi:hypothetical protein